MYSIDHAKVWLPPGAEIAHEAGVIEGGLPERRRRHLRPAQESLNFSDELFCMGHSTMQDIGLFLSAQEDNSYSTDDREFPTKGGMDAVRKLILERVQETGTNLKALSRAIGKNEAYMQQFIRRGVPKSLDEDIRPALAAELGVDENQLKVGSVTKHTAQINHTQNPVKHPIAPTRFEEVNGVVKGQPLGALTPGEQLVGAADLPVFAMAQGGRGALIVTENAVDWVVRPDPLLRVKDGYGMIVAGDSMSPKIEAGSTALVNPHLPPRAGDLCIFRRHADDGTVEACIKELVRATDDIWHVRQYNPRRTFTLKRAQWQVCHVTVGTYFSR